MKWISKNKNLIIKDVAKRIIALVKQKPNAVLGLATGSTMINLYRLLCIYGKTIDWSQIKTFNLDEYKNLSSDSKLSYQHYMQIHLFSHLNINPNNSYFPLASNYQKYDYLIKKSGGIDLQLLGVGVNGHIAFNEPGSLIDSKTRIITLSKSTIKINSKLIKPGEILPTSAYTMGIASILAAKKIYCLAFGEAKQIALKQLSLGLITKEFPVTYLLKHNDTTIFTDLNF